MRQTIQELVERYQNSLYAVAFNVCKNQQDAEDAVQDTKLLFSVRGSGQFKPNIPAFQIC